MALTIYFRSWTTYPLCIAWKLGTTKANVQGFAKESSVKGAFGVQSAAGSSASHSAPTLLRASRICQYVNVVKIHLGTHARMYHLSTSMIFLADTFCFIFGERSTSLWWHVARSLFIPPQWPSRQETKHGCLACCAGSANPLPDPPRISTRSLPSQQKQSWAVRRI